MLNKAVKTVSFIAIATLASKILGMLRDVVLAQSYGAGFQLDAYMVASRIPLLFFDFTLGAAITSTFIPVYNRYLQKGEEEGACAFSSSFINFVLFISALFCLMGILFAPILTNIMAPGYAPETKALTTRLLIIMLPTIIFTALAYSFVGVLQSKGEFNIPAIISLVSNGTIIIYLLFLNKYFGIYGLAFAMLLGWGLQVVVQIPSLIKLRFRLRPTLNLKDPGLRDVFVLAVPILVSSWFQPISVLINTIFGSFMQEGTVTSLELANRLYIIVVGVFAYAITNYAFPSLSKLSGGGDGEGFLDVMKKSLQGMMFIIIPIMIGMILLPKEIVTLVYSRGEFDEKSVSLTSSALLFYSLGMLPYGVNEILNKCFYAMEDGKTPMTSSLVGVGVSIVFAPLFTYALRLGISGLALSVSLSTLAVSVILVSRMRKKASGLMDKDMLVFTGKVVLAALIMGAGVLVAKALTSQSHILIRVGAPTALGAVLYFTAMYLFLGRKLISVVRGK